MAAESEPRYLGPRPIYYVLHFAARIIGSAYDVTSELEGIAAADNHFFHIKAFDLPKQEKNLVIDTAGIVRLGELIAETYLKRQ